MTGTQTTEYTLQTGSCGQVEELLPIGEDGDLHGETLDFLPDLPSTFSRQASIKSVVNDGSASPDGGTRTPLSLSKIFDFDTTSAFGSSSASASPAASGQTTKSEGGGDGANCTVGELSGSPASSLERMSSQNRSFTGFGNKTSGGNTTQVVVTEEAVATPAKATWIPAKANGGGNGSNFQNNNQDFYLSSATEVMGDENNYPEQDLRNEPNKSTAEEALASSAVEDSAQHNWSSTAKNSKGNYTYNQNGTTTGTTSKKKSKKMRELNSSYQENTTTSSWYKKDPTTTTSGAAGGKQTDKELHKKGSANWTSNDNWRAPAAGGGVDQHKENTNGKDSSTTTSKSTYHDKDYYYSNSSSTKKGSGAAAAIAKSGSADNLSCSATETEAGTSKSSRRQRKKDSKGAAGVINNTATTTTSKGGKGEMMNSKGDKTSSNSGVVHNNSQGGKWSSTKDKHGNTTSTSAAGGNDTVTTSATIPSSGTSCAAVDHTVYPAVTTPSGVTTTTTAGAAPSPISSSLLQQPGSSSMSSSGEETGPRKLLGAWGKRLQEKEEQQLAAAAAASKEEVSSCPPPSELFKKTMPAEEVVGEQAAVAVPIDHKDLHTTAPSPSPPQEVINTDHQQQEQQLQPGDGPPRPSTSGQAVCHAFDKMMQGVNKDAEEDSRPRRHTEGGHKPSNWWLSGGACSTAEQSPANCSDTGGLLTTTRGGHQAAQSSSRMSVAPLSSSAADVDPNYLSPQERTMLRASALTPTSNGGSTPGCPLGPTQSLPNMVSSRGGSDLTSTPPGGNKMNQQSSCLGTSNATGTIDQQQASFFNPSKQPPQMPPVMLSGSTSTCGTTGSSSVPHPGQLQRRDMMNDATPFSAYGDSTVAVSPNEHNMSPVTETSSVRGSGSTNNSSSAVPALPTSLPPSITTSTSTKPLGGNAGAAPGEQVVTTSNAPDPVAGGAEIVNQQTTTTSTGISHLKALLAASGPQAPPSSTRLEHIPLKLPPSLSTGGGNLPSSSAFNLSSTSSFDSSLNSFSSFCSAQFNLTTQSMTLEPSKLLEQAKSQPLLPGVLDHGYNKAGAKIDIEGTVPATTGAGQSGTTIVPGQTSNNPLQPLPLPPTGSNIMQPMLSTAFSVGNGSTSGAAGAASSSSMMSAGTTSLLNTASSTESTTMGTMNLPNNFLHGGNINTNSSCNNVLNTLLGVTATTSNNGLNQNNPVTGPLQSQQPPAHLQPPPGQPWLDGRVSKTLNGLPPLDFGNLFSPQPGQPNMAGNMNNSGAAVLNNTGSISGVVHNGAAAPFVPAPLNNSTMMNNANSNSNTGNGSSTTSFNIRPPNASPTQNQNQQNVNHNPPAVPMPPLPGSSSNSNNFNLNQQNNLTLNLHGANTSSTPAPPVGPQFGANNLNMQQNINLNQQPQRAGGPQLATGPSATTSLNTMQAPLQSATIPPLPLNNSGGNNVGNGNGATNTTMIPQPPPPPMPLTSNSGPGAVGGPQGPQGSNTINTTMMNLNTTTSTTTSLLGRSFSSSTNRGINTMAATFIPGATEHFQTVPDASPVNGTNDIDAFDVMSGASHSPMDRDVDFDLTKVVEMSKVEDSKRNNNATATPARFHLHQHAVPPSASPNGGTSATATTTTPGGPPTFFRSGTGMSSSSSGSSGAAPAPFIGNNSTTTLSSSTSATATPAGSKGSSAVVSAFQTPGHKVDYTQKQPANSSGMSMTPPPALGAVGSSSSSSCTTSLGGNNDSSSTHVPQLPATMKGANNYNYKGTTATSTSSSCDNTVSPAGNVNTNAKGGNQEHVGQNNSWQSNRWGHNRKGSRTMSESSLSKKGGKKDQASGGSSGTSKHSTSKGSSNANGKDQTNYTTGGSKGGNNKGGSSASEGHQLPPPPGMVNYSGFNEQQQLAGAGGQQPPANMSYNQPPPPVTMNNSGTSANNSNTTMNNATGGQHQQQNAPLRHQQQQSGRPQQLQHANSTISEYPENPNALPHTVSYDTSSLTNGGGQEQERPSSCSLPYLSAHSSTAQTSPASMINGPVQLSGAGGAMMFQQGGGTNNAPGNTNSQQPFGQLNNNMMRQNPQQQAPPQIPMGNSNTSAVASVSSSVSSTFGASTAFNHNAPAFQPSPVLGSSTFVHQAMNNLNVGAGGGNNNNDLNNAGPPTGSSGTGNVNVNMLNNQQLSQPQQNNFGFNNFNNGNAPMNMVNVNHQPPLMMNNNNSSSATAAPGNNMMMNNMIGTQSNMQQNNNFLNNGGVTTSNMPQQQSNTSNQPQYSAHNPYANPQNYNPALHGFTPSGAGGQCCRYYKKVNMGDTNSATIGCSKGFHCMFVHNDPEPGELEGYHKALVDPIETVKNLLKLNHVENGFERVAAITVYDNTGIKPDWTLAEQHKGTRLIFDYSRDKEPKIQTDLTSTMKNVGGTSMMQPPSMMVNSAFQQGPPLSGTTPGRVQLGSSQNVANSNMMMQHPQNSSTSTQDLTSSSSLPSTIPMMASPPSHMSSAPSPADEMTFSSCRSTALPNTGSSASVMAAGVGGGNNNMMTHNIFQNIQVSSSSTAAATSAQGSSTTAVNMPPAMPPTMHEARNANENVNSGLGSKSMDATDAGHGGMGQK
ncbi:unnamed protein product [Amoebophrya sp. A120]|nr:unnamed protein product [Amoebophrya sp. A120]|eukprot:GSA120T00018233001.1